MTKIAEKGRKDSLILQSVSYWARLMLQQVITQVILFIEYENNITAKTKGKIAWKLWNCVTDAVNNASQY